MLIEFIAALAISSLIGIIVTIMNAQILNQTSSNNNFTMASRQTMNALHWISRDVQMAQTINGTDDFPQSDSLVLTWKTWDNTVHTANYTLEDDLLTRSYVIGSGSPSVLLVARYINPAEDMTNCTSDNGVLTLTITSSVGEGSKVVNVTKSHQISSRPNI